MKGMTKREIVNQFHRLEIMRRKAIPDGRRLILEPNYRDRRLMSWTKAALEELRFSVFRWVAQTLREEEG